MQENLLYRNRKIAILLFLTTLFFSTHHIVYSQTTEDKQAIGFTYKNIIPKNQVSEGDFFDVLVKPQSQQTLMTEISNERSEDIVVKVTINDAKTTEHGLIEYGPNKLESNKKAKLRLSDVLEGPTEVRLKKGQTKSIKLKLKMPKKEFEGALLGGVQLQEVREESSQSGGAILENEYAYIYSVSVRESKKKVDLDFSNSRSYFHNKMNDEAINVIINNDSPEIAKDISLTSTVTSVETGKVVAEVSQKEMKMAPMSMMELKLPFKNAKVGKYKTNTTLSIKDLKWEFETKFEIKEKDLNGESDQAVTVDKKNSMLPFIILLGSLFIGTVTLYLVIRKFTK